MSEPVLEVPDGYRETRRTLHRIAAPVMGRRRFAVSGRFGLRASCGGFATPAYGDGPEVLRVAGVVLVRETTDGAASLPLTGSTLRELALFCRADLRPDFSTGADTPSLGDVDQELALDAESAAVVAAWYDLAWRALDRVLASVQDDADPAVIQLWPEHFDVGTNVGAPSGARVNLGASPGDGYDDEPYLYVGPWGADRPGDPDFWNAPFGSALTRSDLGAGPDRLESAVRYFETGLRHVAAAPRAAPAKGR